MKHFKTGYSYMCNFMCNQKTILIVKWLHWLHIFSLNNPRLKALKNSLTLFIQNMKTSVTNVTNVTYIDYQIVIRLHLRLHY